MDKDRLIAALNAMQDGTHETGHFHDELETLITLVVEFAGGQLQNQGDQSAGGLCAG